MLISNVKNTEILFPSLNGREPVQLGTMHVTWLIIGAGHWRDQTWTTLFHCYKRFYDWGQVRFCKIKTVSIIIIFQIRFLQNLLKSCNWNQSIELGFRPFIVKGKSEDKVGKHQIFATTPTWDPKSRIVIAL